MKNYCYQCIHYAIADDDYGEPVTFCEKEINGFPDIVNCKEFKYETPLGSLEGDND